MIKTIILEDEKDAADALRAYLSQYSAEKGVAFDVRSYDNAVDLLEAYDASADVVFADIQMPLIDGMSAAKKIRDRDKSVLIVFVTNLAQYAIEGYEVGAFDFILKPMRRTSFFMKLDRIINELGHRRSDVMINLHTRDGIRRIAVSDILYAEVMNHDVVLHTSSGESIRMRTTLSGLAVELESHHFALCNACYLVNLRHVSGVDLDYVNVGGSKLRVSQSKRKAFMQAIARYAGGSE